MVLGPLHGRRITLGVTGSIAAYKSAILVRRLLEQGSDIEVVLTGRASRFVGASTFTGILGKPVHRQAFNRPGELHVNLAKRSELILIAPAGADTLAKLATGRASDLLSATVLSAMCPVWVAPAMHPAMWAHPATRANLKQLTEVHGVRVLGPAHGAVASGDEGLGRMMEPEAIVESLLHHFRTRPLSKQEPGPAPSCQAHDLASLRILITAGPTREPIDPVRFLTNRSSGKMGYALIQRAKARGASVVAITGPVELDFPADIEHIRVETALEMQAAMHDKLGPDLSGADAVIMAAAVADFRPVDFSSIKIKKSTGLSLELTANPDLIAELGQRRRGKHPMLVAFALETGDDQEVLAHARQKLEAKGVDLVVANAASDALGRSTSRAHLVTREGDSSLPEISKLELADAILDQVLAGQKA